MKLSNTFNKLFITTLMVTVVMLSGCSTSMEAMDRVGKNIEEGRLVPEEAVDLPDVLNQYTHRYQSPERRDLSIQIDLDRPKVVTSGGEVYAQVALLTRKPKAAPVKLHVLVYDESEKDKSHQAFVNEAIASLQNELAEYARGSLLTLDTAYTRPSSFSQLAAISQPKEALNLKPFLARYALQPYAGKNHHFILLLGDLDQPMYRKRQDMIDMANVLATRGVKLSVLSYGEKPDFAFITKLAERGQGHLAIRTEYFNVEKWLRAEVDYVNAYALKDVKLNLQARNGVKIEKILSPSNLSLGDNAVELELPQIMTGQQYVMMLKLKLPRIGNQPYRDIVSVKASYFSTRTDRFNSYSNSKRVQYVIDRNDARPYKHGRLARSHLILDTKQTVIDVSRLIASKRNYQAIAELTEQQTALQKYLQKEKDAELERDMKVLGKYASNLQKFDSGWFKNIKIWWDTGWDRDRFNQRFE